MNQNMPPQYNYPVPAGVIEETLEVKKSRFIARVLRVTDRSEAMAALEQAKNDYPDARHHCWAYQIGSPHSPSLVAMADDGEPGGTAGKPILNVMAHKDVGDVMTIVIRYFGGIKLGAGGLVRAYSRATQQAYEKLETVIHAIKKTVTVSCDFADEQAIRHWFDTHTGSVEDVSYQEAVAVTCRIDQADLEAFKRFLNTLNDASCIDSPD